MFVPSKKACLWICSARLYIYATSKGAHYIFSEMCNGENFLPENNTVYIKLGTIAGWVHPKTKGIVPNSPTLPLEVEQCWGNNFQQIDVGRIIHVSILFKLRLQQAAIRCCKNSYIRHSPWSISGDMYCYCTFYLKTISIFFCGPP